MFLKQKFKKIKQFFNVQWHQKWKPFFNMDRDGLEATFYVVGACSLFMLFLIVINHFVTTSSYYNGFFGFEAVWILPIFWFLFVKFWGFVISWWFSPLILGWWFTPLVTILAVGSILGNYTLRHTNVRMVHFKRLFRKIKLPKFPKKFKILKRGSQTRRRP
jgi:hypothetical protein